MLDVKELITFINKNKDKDLFSYILLTFKFSSFKYVEDCIDNKELLHQRISKREFNDISSRIATYLIENLNVNDFIKGININNFLSNKRLAVDTKSIHGKFGIIKIKKILEKHQVVNADDVFNKLKIKELNDKLNSPSLQQYANKVIYTTEKYVKGITKKKDNKLKKFDFVILKNLRPIVLIETNFYSTSGTKIGINQGEYVDLKADIESISDYKFFWITDGNYWLTSDGCARFLNLSNYFGDQILNYNLFDIKFNEIIGK